MTAKLRIPLPPCRRLLTPPRSPSGSKSSSGVAQAREAQRRPCRIAPGNPTRRPGEVASLPISPAIRTTRMRGPRRPQESIPPPGPFAMRDPQGHSQTADRIEPRSFETTRTSGRPARTDTAKDGRTAERTPQGGVNCAPIARLVDTLRVPGERRRRRIPRSRGPPMTAPRRPAEVRPARSQRHRSCRRQRGLGFTVEVSSGPR